MDQQSLGASDPSSASGHPPVNLPRKPPGRLARAFRDGALPIATAFKRSSNALGLPGLSEIGALFQALVAHLDRVELAREEGMAINTRVDHLLEILETTTSSASDIFDTTINALSSIQTTLDTHQRNDRRLSFSDTDTHLAELRRINTKISGLMEGLSVQISQRIYQNLGDVKNLQEEARGRIQAVSTTTTNIEQCVWKISERLEANLVPQDLSCETSAIQYHEITNETEIYRYRINPDSSTVHVSERPRSIPDCIVGALPKPEVVCTRGYLNGVLVQTTLYRTSDSFRSRELAKRCIEWHRSYFGPNIAKFMHRVNMDGELRGVVSSIGKMTCENFLQKTSDAVRLVKFVEGIRSSMQYKNSSKSNKTVEMTVDPNGHVTVSPPKCGKGFSLTPCSVFKLPFDRASYHPAVLLTVNAHMISNLWQTHQHADFLRAIRAGSFTPLSVLAALANTDAIPWPGGGSCRRKSPPPVLCPQDLFLECGDDKADDYRTLDSHGTGPVYHQFVYPPLGVYRCMPLRNGWLSYDISRQPHRFRYDLRDENGDVQELLKIKSNWTAACNRAANIAERMNLNMESLELCSTVEVTIALINKNPSQEYLPYEVYFHRHPGRRSSPREFWGFTSTDADPEANSVLLEELGWETHYDIYFDKYTMSKDFGYQHSKLLNEGLAEIPGGFRV